MTRDEDFKLLKIQTCILRVNIHCDGCQKKVKKLLHRVEGVYEVKIEADEQKVTALGSVDCESLVMKLVKAGKHSEVWSPKTNQNQKQKMSCIKDDNNNDNNNKAKKPVSEPLKSKQKEKSGELQLEEEMQQLLMDKINHLAMINHQSQPTIANDKAAKKLGDPGSHNTKQNNTSLNMNMHGDGRRSNDISSMMNLAGFHGSSNGGFELQPNNNFVQGALPFQGMGNPAFMQNRQMLYNRSSFVPPSTAYYYGYGPNGGGDSHIFSDDNADGCMVM